MKILNRLTIRYLTLNKKRTIVTIIGVILSTALMVGIGLLSSSLRDYMIKEVISRKGDYHVRLKDVSRVQYEKLKEKDEISKLVYFEKKYFHVDESYNFIITETSFESLNNLKLIDGRLPNNDKEIVIPNYLNEYNIGDKLKLKLVDYKDNVWEEENHSNFFNKEYEIVGFIDDYTYVSFIYGDIFVYTLGKKIETDNINVYITYSNPKKAYDFTKKIVDDIEYIPVNHNDIKYNSTLLTFYGASSYNNINGFIVKMMCIMLSVVSIGCIMVIYNSFAISVTERKRQFGLFSSIGTTKKQILYMVFFEAIVVGVIGITLGIIGSFIGIGVVLSIINNLLKKVLVYPFALTAYPLFIVIPIIFMIIVIIVSALIPAIRASKVSPISAIRLHEDIKIKKKQIRTNRLIRKMFGIEGEIALKNIKRNKRKYRITVISLFVSIVLFITFSTFLRYGLDNTEEYLGMVDYDFVLSIYDDSEKIDKAYKKITEYKETVNSIMYSYKNVSIKPIEKDFTDEYKKIFCSEQCNLDNIALVLVDDKTYNSYLKLLSKKEHKPIFVNYIEGLNYIDGNRIYYKHDIFKGVKNLNFFVINQEYEVNDDKIGSTSNYVDVYNFDDLYVTNQMVYGIKDIILVHNSPVLLIPNDIYKNLKTKISDDYQGVFPRNDEYVVFIKSNDVKELDSKLETLAENSNGSISFTNITEELELTKNFVFVIKLLLYGFISLISLIGVTSVLNTINTSITLRKKEFAVLRSVGLSNKGFNKMIYFESLFFGLKSLMYALPFSVVVIIIIHNTMKDLIYTDKILWPYNSMILSIIFVFGIVLLIMLYSVKRIKKENILDAIKEENI